MPPASTPLLHRLAVPMMLISGTLTTVCQKFILEQSCRGRAIYPAHRFSKPWFLTTIMFIGELSALVIHRIVPARDDANLQGLLDSVAPARSAKSRLRTFLILGVPAACDLVSSVMIGVGLLFLHASVWQMLRGSNIIFSAIIQAVTLKRNNEPYTWCGVAIVTLSLVIVGLAAVFATGLSTSGVSTVLTIVSVALTIVGQFLRGVQVVVEDYVLHDIAISPYLVVGLEGLWGFLATTCVIMPIVHFVPSEQEGNGIHEDTIDTFMMLGNLPELIGLCILLVIFMFGLNMFGMIVCEITNATMRSIIESTRTVCIWVLQLVLYYALENTEYGQHHPGIGEEWSIWSWMQLAGFGLLVTGMFVYNKMVRLPLLKYDRDVIQASADGDTSGLSESAP
jgi:hypothetical protein